MSDYKYVDSDGETLRVRRALESGKVEVIADYGVAHIPAEEAPFTALAVLEAAGIECNLVAAQSLAGAGYSSDYLASRASDYLKALRIRRDRRAAEEAAKAEAEAEQQQLMDYEMRHVTNEENQELKELAGALFAARYPEDFWPFRGRSPQIQKDWLNVARAAKEHFEGQES